MSLEEDKGFKVINVAGKIMKHSKKFLLELKKGMASIVKILIEAKESPPQRYTLYWMRYG